MTVFDEDDKALSIKLKIKNIQQRQRTCTYRIYECVEHMKKTFY